LAKERYRPTPIVVAAASWVRAKLDEIPEHSDGSTGQSFAWAHPRGFNFLERHGTDDAQLVASEFVTLLADLWPRFCGPKMQHYLRHALFAAFADRDQQTILELIRILTNDAARVRYTNQLTDPMERAFWRDEWPGPRERERDPSIKAVLNKLGAFVSYGSIRSVVGQGDSTISPRMVMDSGDVLVVDLSGVGGDNSALFGAMLISRFAIDAVGRQGRPASERRPHLLVVDEAQRFHTQALEGILAEGRKFGLHAALAAPIALRARGAPGQRRSHERGLGRAPRARP
jgi:hypothetical protein